MAGSIGKYMIGTLLGTSITGTLTSEPELVAHAQMPVATFTIEDHQADGARTYEVFAYGTLAHECVKNLALGQDVTIEGRLTKWVHDEENVRAHDAETIVANRVWLNHLRVLDAKQ